MKTTPTFINQKLLIQECIKENPTAQKAVYENYYAKLIFISIRYLKNKEDSKEVVNNAFLKIFKKINKYKFDGSFEGWMKRIVINEAIDFLRKHKEIKKKFIRVKEFSQYAYPKNNELFVLNEIEKTIDKEYVMEILTDLPPATRVVFNLYAIDGFLHREISKKLNISESTSKWHLVNARKLLQEKLEKKYNKQTSSILNEKRVK